MNELTAVWREIDALKVKDTEKEIRIRVLQSEHNQMLKRLDNICDQLKETDENINTKLDTLIIDYHKREGAKGLAKWMQTLLPIVLPLIIQAVLVFAYFKTLTH